MSVSGISNLNRSIKDALNISGCSDYNKGRTSIYPDVVNDMVTINGNDGKAKEGEPAKKKWTFMYYGAGDNNLSHYIYLDVDEMEAVGSDANTNLISQLDQSSGNCKRFYLQKDNQVGKITSPAAEDMGPSVDMSNPKTLTDAIVWGVTNYPAENVAVIISDHGAGTDGAVADDRDGSFGELMSPINLQKAIKDAQSITGKKLDVLGFDACLMANTEVAYQLKDCADYLIASEQTEGGYGWPYTKILTEKLLNKLQRTLRNKINVTPKDLALKVIKDAEGSQGDLPTLSAIDMAKMNDLAKTVDAFAKELINTNTPTKKLKDLIGKTQTFYGFKDVYDFAQRIIDEKSIKDENLKNSCKMVIDSIKETVIAEQHSKSYPGAHGIQIDIKPTDAPSKEYKELDFAKDTNWDEAWEKIAKG